MIATRMILMFSVAAFVALGTVLWVEHIAEYPPCVLCVYQRPSYVAALLIGLAGARFASSPVEQARVLALLALLFAITAGIAAYHVGVEQGFWQGTSGCGGAGTSITDVGDLSAAFGAPPPASCTDAQATLFGVSMAGYNALAALGLALLAGVFAYITGMRRNG